jgi:hypothetical protein
MKLNRHEVHDRLTHFKQDQALNIFQGAEDCLKKNRLSLGYQQYSDYVYLFAHPRTADDGVNKRMLWQPRLYKPSAQTNSFLFRAKSNTSDIEVCWLLPPREMWRQYEQNMMTEHELVIWSINQFVHHRKELEKPLPDDLSNERCLEILEIVKAEIKQERRMEKLYGQKKTE